MEYFNRNGEPIELSSWMLLHENDEYKIVVKDEVGSYIVSTVWLGLNHNWRPEGPPLIFETMVFKDGDWSGLEQRRYSTEEEAVQGHAAMLNEVALLNFA
jgi:hypothetical protein